MADVEMAVHKLLSQHDDATSPNHMVLSEAVAVTEGLIEELQLRLSMMRRDQARQEARAAADDKDD